MKSWNVISGLRSRASFHSGILRTGNGSSARRTGWNCQKVINLKIAQTYNAIGIEGLLTKNEIYGTMK